jgi:hypothetical protein
VGIWLMSWNSSNLRGERARRVSPHSLLAIAPAADAARRAHRWSGAKRAAL